MRLLLDEHVPREACEALRRKFPELDVASIYDTPLRGLPDPPLLEALDREGRTLVTRDVNSIPDTVKARLAAGMTHGGVIYADSKRLQQSDVRGPRSPLDRLCPKARHGRLDVPRRVVVSSESPSCNLSFRFIFP